MGQLGQYKDVIIIAFTIFPVIAAAVTLPYMIYCYKKYGAVSKFRSVILFTFMLYLCTAYFLVIMPLPESRDLSGWPTLIPNFEPLRCITSFKNATGFDLQNQATWLPAMKSFTFLEPVFNVVLTIPLGIYLTYYFKRGFFGVTFLSFLTSCFFEFTQYTGLYGIYSKAYRQFDVDDLIMNTIGGMVGFFIGLIFTVLLPSKREMDRSSAAKSRYVSYTRHLVSILIDLFAVNILDAGVKIFMKSDSVYISIIIYFAYFIGLQLLTHGRTIGKALVNLRVVTMRRDANYILAIFIRYVPLIAVLFISDIMESIKVSKDGIGFQLANATVAFGVLGLFVVSWMIGFFKDKRLWYELLSHTRLVSTFRRSHSG